MVNGTITPSRQCSLPHPSLPEGKSTTTMLDHRWEAYEWYGHGYMKMSYHIELVDYACWWNSQILCPFLCRWSVLKVVIINAHPDLWQSSRLYGTRMHQLPEYPNFLISQSRFWLVKSVGISVLIRACSEPRACWGCQSMRRKRTRCHIWEAVFLQGTGGWSTVEIQIASWSWTRSGVCDIVITVVSVRVIEEIYPWAVAVAVHSCIWHHALLLLANSKEVNNKARRQ